MIEINDLRKSFNGETILDGINAQFEKGKTNMIIGSSGSGKSVFLKNMLGLFKPDSGEIIYEDERLSEMDEDRQKELRQNMGCYSSTVRYLIL